jgi:hypothetical protein
MNRWVRIPILTTRKNVRIGMLTYDMRKYS